MTGRCRKRKRGWERWLQYFESSERFYLLENTPLRQVFIQIRTLRRHGYAKRQRKEAIKINQGKRTGNASREGPPVHQQWYTQLILNGNFLLRREVRHLVGMYRRFSKTWRLHRWVNSPPTLIIKTVLSCWTPSINPSTLCFQISLKQFYVKHTVHIFNVNTCINWCTS